MALRTFIEPRGQTVQKHGGFPRDEPEIPGICILLQISQVGSGGGRMLFCLHLSPRQASAQFVAPISAQFSLG